MTEESSLSVTLPEGALFRCCATVGGTPDVPSVLGWDRRELIEWLSRNYQANLVQVGLPCAAHYEACPISLMAVAR